MFVPRLWHGCALPVAQLCLAYGTVVPQAWHSCVTGKAMLWMHIVKFRNLCFQLFFFLEIIRSFEV